MQSLLESNSANKRIYRGVEQLVARRAHNPKVVSSSLAPATKDDGNLEIGCRFSFTLSESVDISELIIKILFTLLVR